MFQELIPKMARKNNNNDLRLAAISSIVALLVVMVFFGGTITGNATTAFNATVSVNAVLSCAVNESTLDLGSVNAGSLSSHDSFAVENDGSGNIDISFASDEDLDTAFSSSTGATSLTFTHNGTLSGNGTSAIPSILVTSTGSTGDMVTGLSSIDSTDDEDFSLQITPGSDSANVGAHTINVTVTCA